jgi:glycerol-3-phosphate acyltransferase PlsY
MRVALWVLGGYLIGTMPSTWAAARLSGATRAIRESRRDRGEDDAHLVVGRRAGVGWAAAAAAADVAKALAWTLLSRRAGQLSTGAVALAGAAVVAGHAFPFYLRDMAGRGLAAAAGVFLAVLPLEMIVAGLTMCVGFAVRRSGLLSTVGFGAVPLVAWIRGQPDGYVVMAAAVFALILLRRAEGVREIARERSLPLGRAVLYRVVFDSSGPPVRGHEPSRRA